MNKIPIGQAGTLNKIHDFSIAQNKTFYSPHLIFIARKGMGKTHMARYYAKLLKNKQNQRREIIEINCGKLVGIDFVNDFLIPHVYDEQVTIIFDEAGALPPKVTTILLSICEKNSEKSTFLQGPDKEKYEFDFSNFTFLLCTNEPNKVNEALLSRFLRIELEEYKDKELEEIFLLNFNKLCEGIDIDSELPEIIAKYMRKSPREALNLCDLISGFCHARDINKLNKKTWNNLCKEYKLYPLGLHVREIEILMLLLRRGSMQLQEIAACLRMQKNIVQKEYETYLRDLEFIHTVGRRRITGKGMNYLKTNFNL